MQTDRRGTSCYMRCLEPERLPNITKDTFHLASRALFTVDAEMFSVNQHRRQE